MPELPEVETVRRALAPHVEGRRIVRAEIFDGRLTRPFDPAVVVAELVGERLSEVARRGKYLLFRCASGRTLVVHLRMTGSFRVDRASRLPNDAHRRALLTLSGGIGLAYRDVRRFGTWELLEPGGEAEYLATRLGPEPLDSRFDGAALFAILQGRRAPIKAVLLDQRRLAGVGNIYADEALWRARLDPRRAAGEVTREEATAVHRAVRHVLKRGIERQGSTLRDYTQPDGAEGGMQSEFEVYGRAGDPCRRCGTMIERFVTAGRGTWICPSCQR